jgi:hypothetical protein
MLRLTYSVLLSIIVMGISLTFVEVWYLVVSVVTGLHFEVVYVAGSNGQQRSIPQVRPEAFLLTPGIANHGIGLGEYLRLDCYDCGHHGMWLRRFVSAGEDFFMILRRTFVMVSTSLISTVVVTGWLKVSKIVVYCRKISATRKLLSTMHGRILQRGTWSQGQKSS